MNNSDEPKTAMQAIKRRYRAELPPYQSKEWFDVPNREKIEFMAFGRPFSTEIDFAGNTIRSGLDYHRAGRGTYEEALEVIVLTMHQQLNSLYKERLQAAMLATSQSILLDKL